MSASLRWEQRWHQRRRNGSMLMAFIVVLVVGNKFAREKKMKNSMRGKVRSAVPAV